MVCVDALKSRFFLKKIFFSIFSANYHKWVVSWSNSDKVREATIGREHLQMLNPADSKLHDEKALSEYQELILIVKI